MEGIYMCAGFVVGFLLAMFLEAVISDLYIFIAINIVIFALIFKFITTVFISGLITTFFIFGTCLVVYSMFRKYDSWDSYSYHYLDMYKIKYSRTAKSVLKVSASERYRLIHLEAANRISKYFNKKLPNNKEGY